MYARLRTKADPDFGLFRCISGVRHLREKIAAERIRIRSAAGEGILDLKAVERLKALLRELDAAEKTSSKGEVG